MLRFDNVSYTYPFQDKKSVDNVSLKVRPGEIVLCTGASGCGKSTLVRLANGLCPQFFKGDMEGKVFVQDCDTSVTPLHELADMVGTLFQNPEEQFFALTVEDELTFAHEWRGRERGDIAHRVAAVSSHFGLTDLACSTVHDLSQGQKQKVGLASVMSQFPSALVLDEPTANLDPEATLELGRHLLTLKKRGMAILVVDHRLYWLEGIADRVMIMDKGRIAEEGSFSLLHAENLRKQYGLRRSRIVDVRQSLPHIPIRSKSHGDASGGNTKKNRNLSVAQLTFGYAGKEALYHQASFTILPGVTALIGDNGVGKTTLARLLTGLNKCASGDFSLDGKPVRPCELLRIASIVLQNADHQLYMKTVFDELHTCLRIADLACTTKPSQKKKHATDSLHLPSQEHEDSLRSLLKQGDTTEKKVHALMEAFGLGHLATRHPQSLSGGEKQRLVIACALAKRPSVLILDEPTSGLDGLNMQRIGHILQHCAADGVYVLVITHDLELLELVCTQALRLPMDKETVNAGLSPAQCRDADIGHDHSLENK